ncbi:hypothetical protein ACWDF1_38590 [Streptomyces coelicoflavus]|uniref:hypothetical protein n=1 Tax=Streptomyces coelicoflavus TaxID=285562 RepID=UPI0036B8E55B
MIDWLGRHIRAEIALVDRAGEVEVARSLVSAFFGSQHVSDVLSGRADVVERWRDLSGLLFRSIRAD